MLILGKRKEQPKYAVIPDDRREEPKDNIAVMFIPPWLLEETTAATPHGRIAVVQEPAGDCWKELQRNFTGWIKVRINRTKKTAEVWIPQDSTYKWPAKAQAMSVAVLERRYRVISLVVSDTPPF
jgi:hypothetical protein